MLFERWKQSIVARGKTNVRSGKRRKPPRVALALEWLETRDLLSVVTPNFIIESTQNATTTGASGVHPAAPPASPPPGFSPSQIENAYGFNQISFASYTGGTLPLPGATQTIAIVDAYNDPNIYGDLLTFDSAFGLSNPNLTVVNQSGQFISRNGDTHGGATPPSNNTNWAVEESLDVEWAHAIAPGANIVLVEANDPTTSNMMAAVTTAGTKMGASVVSMSWGGSESSTYTSYDSYFTAPGVTYVASSGDNGAPPSYPATSPNVLAVGGTSLTLNSSGGYGSETGWGGSGGGISPYESLPSYQVAAASNNPNIPGGFASGRTSPDVAYDADPNTGFAVYDSDGGYGWIEVGGTSAGAPQWAALIAIANQGYALDGESSLTGSTQTLPMIYQMGLSASSSTYFHDITSGGNGTYSAGTGYDLVTGLGTPIANQVVNYLVNGPSSSGTPPTPAGLTAAAASSSQINLSWLSNSSATDGFLVYRSTTASSGFSEIGTTAAGVTSYSDTGLNANTTYYYEVFAVNSMGDSAPSNVASATTSTPPAPTGLTAMAVSSNQINLSWNSASNATGGYLIDMSLTGAAGSFTQIRSTTSTTISLLGLNPATTYYYEVFAVNSLGESPPSNIASATTLGTSPGAPPAPTGLTATAASSSQITLSWNTDSGATGGYLIDSSLTGAPGSFTQIAKISSTTISQIGLNPATTYYYEVLAVNSAGDSPPSNIASATTLGTSPTTPPAPTGLTATASSSSQINLSWNSDSGATNGFLVYRSTTASSGFAEIGTTAAGVTSYSDTGLNANTTYYYEVFAVNSAGDSGASNIASASTSTPPAPTGLTATAASSSQINLSWNTDSGATDGYLVYSSLTGAPGSFTQIASITSTTISLLGLNPGTTYYYEVFAVNFAGASPPSNIASATTLGTSPGTPPAPTGLTATAASSSEIDLTWNTDSGATDGFLVYRSTTASSGYSEIGTTAAGVTSYSDTGLNANTTYYYEVFAVNSAGNSGASNVASATTLGTSPTAPPAPTGLTATAVSSSQIDLSWNTDSGATDGYLIDSSLTGAPGSFTQIASITSTTISQIGLNPGTTYYYEVFAVNSVGTSPPSNIASATTQGTSTYVVTSTADDGSAGTLRDAINQVNAGKYEEIDFNIAGTGVQTINLTSALPALTASGAFINGQSENAFQGVNSRSPLIALNGSGAGSSSDGLLLQGSNYIVSGLIIENFSKNGMEVAGSNNTIGGTTTAAGNVLSGNSNDGLLIDSGVSGVQVQGNYIGTNAAGTAALANSGNGIEIQGNGNTIGGSVSGALNLISSNSKDGVLIDSGASGNLVEGNRIGVNIYDSAALGNSGNGIEVAGNSNTIGASYAVAPNEISGNTGDGVLLDSSSSGNQVLGNYIGTNHAGTAAMGNKVGIEDAGSSNTLGGSVLGARNVISGNSGDGVLLDSTATAEVLWGNYIGLSVGGNTALANGGDGVEVQGTGNTIGGNSGANYYVRNFISGNGNDGVLFDSGASGNQVLGNFIGVGVSGTNGVGNVANGIEIAGSSNTIGGTVSGNKNVIAGNGNDGVLLDNTAANNLLQGNYIGTDYSGRFALANSGNGIEIQGTGNTVGGTSGSRNLLSGNSNDGVKIDSGASGNLVLGNYIGVNTYDTAVVGNSGNGIEVAGNSNTIGASYAVAPNEISGNSNDGVLLDSSSSGNQVLGNYIGTNHAGLIAMANKVGIEDAGSSNTIGGSVLGARNVVSGNSGDGVLLDSTATAETIEGNAVGVNVGGNTALANGANGVEVQGTGNTIGGNSVSNYYVRNFISGNKGDGVLFDSSASGNQVLGNFIGVGVNGTTGVGNVANDIEIAGSSNTIGGTLAGYRNVLSGSGNDGVLIDGTGANNLLQGNLVGTDYSGKNPVANSGNGIEIAGNNNTVGGTVSGAGNTISGNSKNGVLVSAGSGDTISRNSIFANAGLGISLASGANNNIAAPSLSSATLSGSTLTVTGAFTAPTANVAYVLEFFANPSGDPEGKIYLGSLTVTPTSTGSQSFTFTTTTTVTGANPLITATLTDATDGTSTFSNGVVS